MEPGNGPVIVKPEEGLTYFTPNNLTTIKAWSNDTNGAYGLFLVTSEPGFKGPPPHIHHKTEDAFYMLEGELTVYVGDQIIHATPGTFVLVPRGTVHTFSNLGDRPAKSLGIFSPGGSEQIFADRPEINKKYGDSLSPEAKQLILEKYDIDYVEAPPSWAMGHPHTAKSN